MKASELLTESITFNIGKIIDDNGDKIFADPFQRKEKKECWYCDGSGVDPQSDDDHKYPCSRCKGEKETEEWTSDSPELNVSNDNAMEILNMLGIPNNEIESVGTIDKSKLPEIMRRLIKLKNGDISAHTSSDTKNQPKMQHYKDDTGMDRIGYNEPRIYNFGRSHSQVERYIDRLIAMIQFAQKNDCTIGWG